MEVRGVAGWSQGKGTLFEGIFSLHLFDETRSEVTPGAHTHESAETASEFPLTLDKPKQCHPALGTL